MEFPVRRLRISIPVKISLLVILTVIVSLVAFSSFIFYRVEREERAFYTRMVGYFGRLIGEQIWTTQTEIKKDMTSILALIDPRNLNKDQENQRILVQKSPGILYYAVIRMKGTTSIPLFSVHNEKALTAEVTDHAKLEEWVDENARQLTSSDVAVVNYHFVYPAEGWPIYIFEVDRKTKLYAVFALSRSVFAPSLNETEPISSIVVNDREEVLYGDETLPYKDFLKVIASRSTNFGLVENHKENENTFSFSYFRAADGITLLTSANLEAAGFNAKTYIRDLTLFMIALSLVMLAVSLLISSKLSQRIRRLMGITEKIAAGNFSVDYGLPVTD
jgi:hypothetical protein